MKLSELEFRHSTTVARCYSTSYYGDRHCKVVPSKTKGLYKIQIKYRYQGYGKLIGSKSRAYSYPCYVVGKNYTATEIHALHKKQERLNAAVK